MLTSTLKKISIFSILLVALVISAGVANGELPQITLQTEEIYSLGDILDVNCQVENPLGRTIKVKINLYLLSPGATNWQWLSDTKVDVMPHSVRIGIVLYSTGIGTNFIEGRYTLLAIMREEKRLLSWDFEDFFVQYPLPSEPQP